MAGMAVTRQALTATELRAAAGKTRDVRAARRMLALALALEGGGPRNGGHDQRHGPPDAAG